MAVGLRRLAWITALILALVLAGCRKAPGENVPPTVIDAQPAPVAASPSAPVERFLVICGTADAPNFGSDAVYRLRDAGFGRAAVVDTNRYVGLTPDLFVVIADALDTQDAATQAVANLAGKNIECYAKPATAKTVASARPPVFIGTGQMMWGCADADSGFLSYAACREKFADGATVLRPPAAAQTCTWINDPKCVNDLEKGIESVRAAHVQKTVSEEPCGDYASFDAPDAGAATPKPAWKKFSVDAAELGSLRKYLESKYRAKFPSLSVRNAVEIDLDGDGATERILDLTAGFRSTENIDEQIAGDILQHVAIWKNGKPVAELFTNFALAKAAREEYYVGHIYGGLAALTDIDGDRLIEILIVSGYHEGEGVEIHVFRKGRLTRLVSEGCGA